MAFRRLVPALALVGVALSVQPADAADAAAGERVFKAQCSACHSPAAGKNLIGPSLFGVVGRHSGSIEGFRYSNANKSADITWTPEVLDKYLTNPQQVVKGTIMAYAGLRNEKQRADLISYLETLK